MSESMAERAAPTSEHSRPFLSSAHSRITEAAVTASEALRSSKLFLEDGESIYLAEVLRSKSGMAFMDALRDVVLTLNDGHASTQDVADKVEADVADAAESLIQAYVSTMEWLTDAVSSSAETGRVAEAEEKIRHTIYGSVNDVVTPSEVPSLLSLMSEVRSLSVEARRLLNGEALAIGIKERYVTPHKGRITLMLDPDALPVNASTTLREAVSKRDNGSASSRLYASFRLDNGEDPGVIERELKAELEEFTAHHNKSKNGAERGLLAYPLMEKHGDKNVIVLCAVYSMDHTIIEGEIIKMLRARMKRHEKPTWYNPVSEFIEKGKGRRLEKKARK
jgi:hypothetical protein